MRVVVKRREITDPGQLQALVIDHVDGIEPGLAVLDSRLLLGQATIDVVGLDAHGTLVLMAVGFTADEEMLLKAVEAYSWCLEYPEAIRRLYPAAQVSSSQPPRLMFIFERMPDSFHRKIKQLGFPEVDCVEFRNLEVDGTPAVYFDTLARLRRGPVAAAPAPERTVTPAAPAPTGRPTSLKLQKLLGADRPGPVREPAQVVSMVRRTAPRVETPKPALIAPKMESAAAPRLVDEPAPVRPVAAIETPAASLIAVVEPAFLAAPIVAPEPEPIVAPPATVEPVISIAPAPEPPVAPIATIEAAAQPLVTPEPFEQIVVEPVVVITTPEPMAVPPIAALEPVVESIVAPEPIVVGAGATETVASEPEAPSITAAPELTLATIAQPEPVVVTPEPEPIIPSVPELEPSLSLATTPDPEPVLALAAEPVAAVPELEVAEVATAPITATPAPSVFARRPAEPVAAAVEPKVSFADVAKDLLAVTNPTPRIEAPATIQRPSVEEMTRAALDDLVGATEKRVAAAEDRATAFGKPATAFSKPTAHKRPRTIAPPPADPQPIATGPKRGAAPKRLTPPAAGAKPEVPAAPDVEPEAAQPVPPQGFEGLQFPNDGVLTRQWMEFLNQMAAGK